MDFVFVRKLRREIAGSPKKASLLALLMVVAVWFWAPLVMKAFSKSENSTADAARTANKNSASAPGPAASTPAVRMTNNSLANLPSGVKGRLPSRRWRQVVASMDGDARMQSATELASMRDPFKAPVVEPPAPKKREAAVVEKPDLTPALAGLVLNSTIVGQGANEALIGGQVYKEGSIIAAAGDEGRFRLVEIRPREVILERNGRLYTLGIPKSEWAKGH